MTIPSGTNLGRYEIRSQVGAGGMGEVYLAQDKKLDRKVALKVLPAEFTQDAERLRRFTQEAKAASALNHPNIISVYDIGECENGRFIVMELAGAYLNAGRFAEGLEAGRRLITLSPNYYWGYLWSAMNAVGLGQIEEARTLVREALRVKPELSFELARKCLGTMAPDVDRRFSEALRHAGLEEKR